jgi:hypothetical protein
VDSSKSTPTFKNIWQRYSIIIVWKLKQKHFYDIQNMAKLKLTLLGVCINMPEGDL